MISLSRRQRFYLCPSRVGTPPRGWKLGSLLSLLLLALTALTFSAAGNHPISLHAAPLPQSTPTCDAPTYHGVHHCAHGDVHTVVVDLTDPHVRVQTVLARNGTGVECNSVNPTSKDPTSNCSDPYPFETLASMLGRYKNVGAVAAINTDYFGCGGPSAPCGSPTGDHGAQGLAVRNGVRLDGPAHGVTNDLAYTTPSLAVSPLNLVTIDIPGSQATIDSQLDGRYYNTVGGSPLLITGGAAIASPCSQAYHAPYGDTCNALPDPDGNIIEAQSAAGVSSDGTTLILATAGLNAEGLATYLVNNGPALTAGAPIERALKFDGGGSARLAWLNPAGTVNSYSPTGQNRPIAEALLIFSDKIATAPPGMAPSLINFSAEAGTSVPWNLTVSTGAAPIDKGDVMLVFDRTGSMADEIAEAKRSALEIMNAVLDEVPNTWFGIAGFMDYPDTYIYPGYTDGEGGGVTYGNAGDLPWQLNLVPTADIVTVADVLNREITLGRGGDGPESYTRMLDELRNIAWRNDVKKVAVVFGDAPAHDLDFFQSNWGGDPGPDAVAQTADDLDFETVLQAVRNAGITIIAVNSLLPDDSDDDTYYADTVTSFRSMSIGTPGFPGTGGQYFELAEAAQIPLVTANLILAESRSVDELSLRVTEGFESWVTVTPNKFEQVGANAAKEFSVLIAPPAGTPAGFYPFLIQAIGDGAILGVTPVEVTVPVIGGTNDTGFRPSVDGYRSAGSASVQTWAMFRQFFGAAQVEYSNGNRLYAADRFFTQSYANAGNTDSSAGFVATSILNFHPTLAQPNAGSYAMPSTPDLYAQTTVPALITDAIAFAQGVPTGLEIGFQKANLCALMEKSPAAMYFTLRAQLQAGDPPIVSLFNAEPAGSGATTGPERTLVPYRIEEPATNEAKVYVYDPIYPGNDNRFIEFRWNDGRTLDEWRYATPAGVWQGDSSACLLAITPLSLFTHTGVAWWKAGPSWPPSASTAVSAATSAGLGGGEEPPAVRLYRATGAAALLITDREGRRLGYNGTQFYDEINGATFVPTVGAKSTVGGNFYVPVDVSATAQLIGTGAGSATLTTVGEGALVEVDVQGLVSGTITLVALDETGEGVSVTARNNAFTGRVAINRLLTAEDRTVQIGNLNLRPDDTVTFTFRPAAAEQETIALQTDNSLDQQLSLSLQRSGEGIEGGGGFTTFGVDTVALPRDATLTIQPDSWVAPAQVTLVITDAAANVDRTDIPADELVAASIVFEPSATELSAAGDQLPLTVAVRDQFGNYITNGTAVSLSTTHGTLSSTSAGTVNGRVTSTLTYTGNPGEATVTAQVGDIETTIVVTFRAPTGLLYQMYLPFVRR